MEELVFSEKNWDKRVGKICNIVLLRNRGKKGDFYVFILMSQCFYTIYPMRFIKLLI